MNSMNKNLLLKLESFGQSVWLDSLSRYAITSGQLKRLIDEDASRNIRDSIFLRCSHIEQLDLALLQQFRHFARSDLHVLR